MQLATYDSGLPIIGEHGCIIQVGAVQVFRASNHPSSRFLWQRFSDQEPDYWVVPHAIRIPYESSPEDADLACQQLLAGLPNYTAEPERHVFFTVSDSPYLPVRLRDAGSPVFQFSCHRLSKGRPMPYTSNLMTWLSQSPPVTDAKIQISFQGNSRTHACRGPVLQALRESKFTTVVRETGRYTSREIMHTLAGFDDISGYVKLIQDSVFCACPRGMGLTSIRFFETIAAGRIPILIADDTQLPLASMIDWASLIVRVPEGRLDLLDQAVERFLADHDITVVSRRLRQLDRTYFANFRGFLTAALTPDGCRPLQASESQESSDVRVDTQNP